MEKLSAYVLARNSERHLASILQALTQVADDIVVLDSGSTDATKSIVENFSAARFVYRDFDTFKNQRNYAADACVYDWVLFLDSDELPDEDFLGAVIELKATGFSHDAYTAKRVWNVLGKNVHCVYPIVSPDYPIRLFNKTVVRFGQDSNDVHETPTGYKSHGAIAGNIVHITFETEAEMNRKLDQYSALAAKDTIRRNKPIDNVRALVNPVAAFVKWYLLKGGFKDGLVGLTLGKYAYDYTRLKYRKAKQIARRNA